MSFYKYKLRAYYTDGSSRVAFFTTQKAATNFYNMLLGLKSITNVELIKL